jgi:hypothetical protein
MDYYKATKMLFDLLEVYNIRYAVYNGYEELPEKVSGGLDIAVEKKAFRVLDLLIKELSVKLNLWILAKIWHDDHKIAYILVSRDCKNLKRLQLDFMYGFSISDRTTRPPYIRRFDLIPGEMMLENRLWFGYFYKAAPHLEFIQKLFRRIFKGDFHLDKVEVLKTLFLQDESTSSKLLRFYFGDLADEIQRRILKADPSWFNANLSVLKNHLKKYKRNIISLKNTPPFLLRLVNRIFHPVGFVVVLLGPDRS